MTPTTPTKPPTQTSATTYCRLCEPHCGMTVTLEEGRIAAIRGDAANPASKGYVCGKGTRMAAVVYHPDRVLTPLRRSGEPGDFEPVSWEDALDDIAARLRAGVAEHGPDSVALYHGNPAAYSVATGRWASALMAGIGSTRRFSPTPQDTGSRFVANALLYGAPLCHPIPDLAHTDLLLIVGANPLITHGSLLSVGGIRREFREIEDRGGRIVVVDPVRTRTAAAYEHVAVVPDTDAWLLAAMIREVVDAGLADLAAIERYSAGFDELIAALGPSDLEAVARRTGVPAGSIVALAHDFATAPRAVVYGRIGACRGSFPTLTNVLIDVLNLVTGNFDRRGGAVLARGLVDPEPLPSAPGERGFGRTRTRVGNYPEVNGNLAWTLPQDMLASGPDRVRTLLMCAGNPVLSAPGSADTVRGLERLDLHVSLDLFVNESNCYADYVLPVTTFLERDDATVVIGPFMPRPWAAAGDRVIAPVGKSRDEWWIYDQLLKRLDLPAPASDQDALLDSLLGASGLTQEAGLTLAELRRHPHGVGIDAEPPVGWALERIAFLSGGRQHRVELATAEVLAELDRLHASGADPDPAYPLRLVGRRDLRRLNSWLDHAQPAGRTHAPATLWMHPADARVRGIATGDRVVLATRVGAVEVDVEVDEVVVAGAVCYPHGWGHRSRGRSWSAPTDGVNINQIIPNDEGGKEALSGMSHLDGVPVEVRVAAPASTRGVGAPLP